ARDDGARDAPGADSSFDVRADAIDAADATDVRTDGARADVIAADASTDGSPPTDASNDPLVDSFPIDVSDGAVIDAACVPESDREFCARLGKTCDVVINADNCGAKRSANCGTCSAGLGCVDGVCKTPVCSSFTFSSAVYRPFSVTGGSDVAIATSSAGESVLYAQAPGPDCASPVVYLADEITPGARTYTSRSLSAWLDANGTTGQALSGDGLTIVTLSKDFRTFQSARRSALQLLDFGTLSSADFTAVNAMISGTPGSFRGGVLSPDGIELFFTIFNGGPAIDGIYSAKRSATNVPFSAGARLVGVDAAYTDVTGVSSDRLALFVFKPWAGFVFTRTSTSADFSNPNAPNAPPELAGWQHKPFGDCATLLATYAASGGCINEDVVFQARK
ncbi:MAG: hypothetical protein ABW133_15525, partial [Polyangiaceae bacterium]